MRFMNQPGQTMRVKPDAQAYVANLTLQLVGATKARFELVSLPAPS